MSYNNLPSEDVSAIFADSNYNNYTDAGDGEYGTPTRGGHVTTPLFRANSPITALFENFQTGVNSPTIPAPVNHNIQTRVSHSTIPAPVNHNTQTRVNSPAPVNHNIQTRVSHSTIPAPVNHNIQTSVNSPAPVNHNRQTGTNYNTISGVNNYNNSNNIHCNCISNNNNLIGILETFSKKIESIHKEIALIHKEIKSINKLQSDQTFRNMISEIKSKCLDLQRNSPGLMVSDSKINEVINQECNTPPQTTNSNDRIKEIRNVLNNRINNVSNAVKKEFKEAANKGADLIYEMNDLLNYIRTDELQFPESSEDSIIEIVKSRGYKILFATLNKTIARPKPTNQEVTYVIGLLSKDETRTIKTKDKKRKATSLSEITVENID